MNRFWSWMIVLFIVVGGCFEIWYYYFRETEEGKVRSMLESAAAAAEKKGEKNALTAAADFGTLKDFFEEKVTVSGSNKWLSGTYERDEMIRRFMASRVTMLYFKAELHDIKITIQEEGRATASFTAYASGKMKTQEALNQAFECCVNMQKDGKGKYRITEAEISPVASMNP